VKTNVTFSVDIYPFYADRVVFEVSKRLRERGCARPWLSPMIHGLNAPVVVTCYGHATGYPSVWIEIMSRLLTRLWRAREI